MSPERFELSFSRRERDVIPSWTTGSDKVKKIP